MLLQSYSVYIDFYSLKPKLVHVGLVIIKEVILTRENPEMLISSLSCIANLCLLDMPYAHVGQSGFDKGVGLIKLPRPKNPQQSCRATQFTLNESKRIALPLL